MLDLLTEEIKADEGFVPYPYLDSLGFETIGYGFLVDKRKGGGMPRWVADVWLEGNLYENRKALFTRLPWLVHMPDDVLRGIQNMCYQLGLNGLLKFKNMLSALERGDRRRAAVEALNSKWAKQTPQRAVRVAKLIAG